jgi:hypothetical protein
MVPSRGAAAETHRARLLWSTSFHPMFEIKLAALGAAVLKGPWPQVTAMPAANLWKDESRPTVIYAIRRLG